MLENAGNASAPTGGFDEAAHWQPQMMEAELLFHLLADQHRSSLDQVAANQNAANQQMWNQVA